MFRIAIVLIFAAPVHAETIAIIGTGNVGATIGSEFAEQGHRIVYGSRSPAGLKALDLARKTGKDASTDTPQGAAQRADIIVLAVPGMVATDVAAGLGDVAGKLVIDVTNPLVTDEAMHFSLGVDTSNGELIQATLDGAVVVKALNTVSWQLMAQADELDEPITIPLSGDDDEAKQVVAELLAGMGFETLDIGGIETSRWSELTAVVMLNNRFAERTGFNLHLHPVQ